jgi:hypothetical protein
VTLLRREQVLALQYARPTVRQFAQQRRVIEFVDAPLGACLGIHQPHTHP